MCFHMPTTYTITMNTRLNYLLHVDGIMLDTGGSIAAIYNVVIFLPIRWSQVLSLEWRCSWSSADRWCFKYIWLINNFITYKGTTYIRILTEIVPSFTDHIQILWFEIGKKNYMAFPCLTQLHPLLKMITTYEKYTAFMHCNMMAWLPKWHLD